MKIVEKIREFTFGAKAESAPKNTTKKCTYAELLGLNRPFKFTLSRSKVGDRDEFKALAQEAESLLEQDLKRLGESFYSIDPALRTKLMGVIGSMTLLANDDGKLRIIFHKRDENGLWDGASKKYPEKDTTAKYRYEVFFVLEDEEED